jgi:hypothetical protein
VLWSLIRGLGPGIRDGLVRLWVLDPRGCMELAAGQPLFARFAYDSPSTMATVLEETVEVMQARAARLRGVTRLCQPNTEEPLIVVVVDELASLTAYAESGTTAAASAPPCPCCSPRAAPWASWSSPPCRTPARKSCHSETCSPPASPSPWSRPNRPTSC